ncbi:hypothetical protein SDC9_152738 [bioreactor metagenome]|uniref:Uncharacterized protein n=1 Tax=bioreactor metagenome TaxID=1076179 RepID=A0A645EUF8_9ZZZZ
MGNLFITNDRGRIITFLIIGLSQPVSRSCIEFFVDIEFQTPHEIFLRTIEISFVELLSS